MDERTTQPDWPSRPTTGTQDDDGAGPAPAEEDEAPPPRRRPARAGCGCEGRRRGRRKARGWRDASGGKATAADAAVARREDVRGAAMADERDEKGGVAAALPTDALKEAGQQLLGLLVQRATEAAAQRVSGLADRLTDVTRAVGTSGPP